MKNWLSSEKPDIEEIENKIDRLYESTEYEQDSDVRSQIYSAINRLKDEVNNLNLTNAELELTDKSNTKEPVKKRARRTGEKTASPIKDVKDIKYIAQKLKAWGYFREAHMMIIGCNVALRYSDLSQLKFSDITVKSDGTGYIEQITEKKTQKTKSITFNKTAMKSIQALLEWFNSKDIQPIYIFQGTGNRCKNTPKPVSRSHVNDVLKYAREDLHLDFKLSTHSFRKTFGHNAYNDGKGINIKTLQKLFNHASESETFAYIGITHQRVQEAYIEAEIEIEI
ncbi:tyrosine-type recombinase/integrase [Pseudoalteromonas sp. C2R02]|nr:tyrosine-type recombinase/integrase [Pseudoalteromonas sp. C2R02]